MKTLPPLLVSRLKNILGNDFDSVQAAFSSEKGTTFRVNSLKSSKEEIEAACKDVFPIVPVLEIPWAYELPKSFEYALKGSSLFREGKIYLQSLSSMLPVLALAPKWGSRVLDVCAAPGSKTTQMASMMTNSGTILALEQNAIRMDILRHTLAIQGATNIETIKVDARRYLGDILRAPKDSDTFPKFDAVLLDAPCSAEWRIRLSDEKTFGFFSQENYSKKSSLQKELIQMAFDCLRPGGVLVYATCTLAPEENEGVVTELLQTRPNASIVPCGIPDFLEKRSGILQFEKHTFHPSVENTVRILPSNRFEWFYIARIQKR